MKFMSVATSFPVTLAERLKQGPGVVRWDADWEEYLDLLEACDYQIEYDHQQIIAMSIASDPHEAIVKNIIVALSLALDEKQDIHIRPSNRHIFIEEFKKDYAPDAHVVKGTPVQYTLRKGLTANTNPWLVVEVLSPSTYERDWNEKLPFYKKIPSIRHIVYIEQERVRVSVYSRVGDSAVWENVDYDTLEQSFDLDGATIHLKDVYKKVLLPKPGNGKASNKK